MIDLSKLKAAPWFVNYAESTDDNGNGPGSLFLCPHEEDIADSFAFSEGFSSSDGIPEDIEATFDFIALARNALDVMMRRGWGVAQFKDGWDAIEDRDGSIIAPSIKSLPDPFTALVEADKWYVANVENKR